MLQQKLPGDCGIKKRRLLLNMKSREQYIWSIVGAALTHRDSDRLLNTGNWIELLWLFPVFKGERFASPSTIRPLRWSENLFCCCIEGKGKVLSQNKIRPCSAL